MKTWINVAVGVFFLSSVWKECLSHLLQEEVSDLASLQDVNAIERTDDLHGYAEGEKDIKDSNAEDSHSYKAFLKDSSYRRRPNRHCICYRRSSRRRGNGGWRPLPRPYN